MAGLYQLRVMPWDVSPLVWRRLLIPSESSIAHLHKILQFGTSIGAGNISPLPQLSGGEIFSASAGFFGQGRYLFTCSCGNWESSWVDSIPLPLGIQSDSPHQEALCPDDYWKISNTLARIDWCVPDGSSISLSRSDWRSGLRRSRALAGDSCITTTPPMT